MPMRKKTAILTLPSQVHDEIGRGDFLAIYMASGVFGSFASLAAHVLAGRLSFTSLGASGAICGIVAAWMMMHAKYVPRLRSVSFI